MEIRPMQIEEINKLIAPNLSVIEKRHKAGRGNPFDCVIFSNGASFEKNKWGKFVRLLAQGHVEEAKAFVLNAEMFRELNAKRKKDAASRGGVAAMQNANNHICNRSFQHWSKGTIGKTKAWNKGLSKETDIRCINISESKKGEKNPMFGRPVSDETRKKLSEKAKHNILIGKWTPNAFNSRTRKQLLFRGKLFRSSWEALFFQAHPTALYEHLRIPYVTDKKHVYITDFVIDRTVYEIKPQKHIKLKKDKLNIVDKWCNENGYHFIILDEFSLTRLIPLENVIFDEFDSKTQKLLRGLYESVKKRVYTKA